MKWKCTIKHEILLGGVCLVTHKTRDEALMNEDKNMLSSDVRKLDDTGEDKISSRTRRKENIISTPFRCVQYLLHTDEVEEEH